MFKRVKYAVLKIRELYNRWMWSYCMNKSKGFECDKKYREMYIWKDKAAVYSDKRKQLMTKIWNL